MGSPWAMQAERFGLHARQFFWSIREMLFFFLLAHSIFSLLFVKDAQRCLEMEFGETGYMQVATECTI